MNGRPLRRFVGLAVLIVATWGAASDALRGPAPGRGASRWSVAIATLQGFGPSLAAAQEAGPAPPVPAGSNAAGGASFAPLEFRRVQIREEQLAEFARGYLPLRESEFQQLLDAARRTSSAAGPSAAGCVRADYAARFDADALVDGTAELQLRTGRQPAPYWSWDDSNLPLIEPHWGDDPARPALTGLVPSGRQAVLIEPGSPLKFAWSLRGRRLSRDAIQFVLRAPPAALQTLTLDLPASLAPVCRAASIEAPAEQAGESAGARRVWRLHWQGDGPLELELTAVGAKRPASSGARVRQNLNYTIDLKGLELQAELSIDVTGRPLQTLVLAIDRRLQPASVRLGDKAIPWTRRLAAPPEIDDELTLELGELTGEERRVQLTAYAPPEFGGPWTLPTLHPVNGLWLEGEARVTVIEPLVAAQLSVQDGRIVHATSAPRDRRRTWQVRLHEPQATLRLSADVPSPRLKVRCGTTVSTDGGSMTGRWAAELATLGGAVQQLDLELPRAWLLDGVDSLDGPAVEEFQLSPSSTQGRQRLQIRLREPLTAGRTLRLAVRARRQPPGPNVAVAADQLRLVRMLDGAGPPHDVRHLVAVNSGPNTRLRFTGDQGLAWLDPARLSEADLALVEPRSGGRLFLADRAAEELEVRFERDRPRFRAEIEATATVRGGRLFESYRFDLHPDASQLDRIPVFFSHARPGALHWRTVEPAGAEPQVRRVAPAGEPTGERGETWEIGFARPVSERLVLIAERSTALVEPLSVSLASLPEAAEQQGRLRLVAAQGAVHWVNQGLHPLAEIPEEESRAAAVELGVVPGTVSYLRYEPASDDAVLAVPDAAESSLARLWAWQGRLETTFGADGFIRHRWDFELENVGASEATFEAPPTLRLERLLVNGVDRTTPSAAPDPSMSATSVRCPLPTGETTVRVRLEFSARTSPPGWRAVLTTPRLRTNFPVLVRRWRVNLPGPWAPHAVRTVEDRQARSGGEATAAAAPVSDRSTRDLAAPPHDPLWPGDAWSDRLFGLVLRDRRTARPSEPVETPVETPVDGRPTPWSPASTDDPADDPTDGWQLFAEPVSASTNALTLTPVDPASASASASASPAPALGWHAFTIELPPSGQVELRVADRRAAEAFAWAALLATAALLGWVERRLPWSATFAAVAFGWIALLAPGPVAVAASGAFLGALAAPLAARASRRTACGESFESPGESAVRPARATPGSTAARIVTPLVLLALAGLAASPDRMPRSTGQETVRPARPAAEPNATPNGAPGDATDSSAAGRNGAAPSAPYRLLIPVDDERRAVGEYVHLPRELYHELRRRAERNEADGGAWFLKSADYDVTLRDGEAAYLEVVADYAVEVRRAGEPVVWPLDRRRVTVIDARATRGVESLEADWVQDERGWSWTPPAPGVYRVVFRLHVPAPRDEAGDPAAGIDARQVAFPIPPVSTSRVRLRGSADGARPTLLEPSGGVERTDERGERSTPVGAARVLRFGWGGGSSPSPAASAEQLLWMQLRPGSVQLDVVLRLAPAAVPSSRLIRLRHDPSLRLLPAPASPAVARIQPLVGVPGGLAVELAEGEAAPEIRLSFLLAGVSGVGRVVVPRIEWLDGRYERRWLAATVAPSLELARQEGGALEPLVVPSFLQAWGPSDALPHVAYRLGPDDDSIVFSVRQRDVDWTAAEQSAYRLRRDRGELTYTADLSVGGAPSFQYELLRRGSLRISEVALQEAPEWQTRPVRWALAADGRLQVLADQPLAGAHRLIVTGDFPLPFDKEFALPGLTLASRTPAPRSFLIARHEGVLVERVESAGWEPVAGAALPASPADAAPPASDAGPDGALAGPAAGRTDEPQDSEGTGRIAAAGRWTGGADATAPAPPSVLVRLNRPRVRGRLLSALVRSADGWEMTLAGRLDVDRGKLESVRLDVPPEWPGPRPVGGASGESKGEPSGDRWTLRPTPGQTRLQLSTTAPDGAGSPWEFRLRAPVVNARAERVRAPDVQLLDAVAVDRYVALPMREGNQRLVWETSGLRAVVQPDGWLSDALATAAPTDGAAPRHQLYQVVAGRFQAALIDVDDESPDSKVRSAVHRLHARNPDAVWGEASITVQSGSRHECYLELPDGQRLLQVRVAGAIALVEQVDGGRWRTPLPADRPVQQIELLYLWAPDRRPPTAADAAAGRLTERLPRVQDWQTETTTAVVDEPPRSSDDRAGRLVAALTVAGVAVVVALGRRRTAWRDRLGQAPALPAVLLGIAWWLWCEPPALGLLIGAAGLLAAHSPWTFRLGTKRPL